MFERSVCVVFSMMILLAYSCQVPIDYSTDRFKFKEGDDLSYAAKSYPDNTWKTGGKPVAKPIYWARFYIPLTPEVNSFRHLGINIHAFGAYEAFWDGIWIGNNGQVKTHVRNEQPGTESSYILVPGTLTGSGVHTLALRLSQTFDTGHYRGIVIRVGDYHQMVRLPLVNTAFMYILAGAFLIVSLFYLFLYINSPEQKLALLFSVTCLLFFALLIVEYAKFYIEIPYTHFYTRLAVVGLLTFAISFLVPFYFATQFSVKQRRWVAPGLFVLLGSIYLISYEQYDIT
ncbi:MAG TPA: hypothetical protein VEZ17_08530, partial [Chitinophagaceae bacterium]|nr:hypothetical protein [Chitinophagaceae bacterium]